MPFCVKDLTNLPCRYALFLIKSAFSLGVVKGWPVELSRVFEVIPPSQEAIVLRIQRTRTDLADKSLCVSMQRSTARRTDNFYWPHQEKLRRHTIEIGALFRVD